ncbi:transient receptor potential cation channel subfamily A member 1-like [Boleophthalmus pectinirostris]|uniref:transient receptor potential cation channel subfamily A member 1-like n=1 Tax=Boleophthalmus pectinirostris TaxID=150288 RepID=UPI0024328789|nr:transient receptor potential cation channel subfamily A member 1-like [Boleophthalmus pectinirostris]
MDRVRMISSQVSGSGLRGVENRGLEMEETGGSFSVSKEDEQNKNKEQTQDPVQSAARWASYSCGRWRQKRNKLLGVTPEVRYRGLAGDADDELDSSMNLMCSLSGASRVSACFTLRRNVDLDLLDELLSDGADPNSSDRFGQTVLHEISRAWSVDVMRFFLDRGSNLMTPDQFGVTALHVAAALDYSQMVLFLLQRNADPESRTRTQAQTPLHFAAKSDAVFQSIRVLVLHGASLGSVDYKLRTPLQLAANMERRAAARVLLELGAEAGLTDRDGQLLVTALISHMSPVAELALNQFHVHDTMSRQQYFHLNLLEPEPVDPNSKEADLRDPTSPLEVVVHRGKLDLIMNPVFLKLIEVKWNLYGRMGAWLLLILNFLFNVSWTTVAISVSVTRDSPQRYVLPQDWWRVLLAVVALLFTLEEVLREVIDIRRSNRKLRLQQKWEQRRRRSTVCFYVLLVLNSLCFQDRVFLEDQLKSVQNMRGNYSRDLWNLSDWLVYCLLGVSTAVHVADVIRPSDSLHVATLRLFSVSIIFLWLRLMKYVRAFRLMGPFIVMLGKVAADVMRFLFLYVEIFIPYACSFWIIFGGAVPSMQTVGDLLFTLYRMTLVDEYDYSSMQKLDSVMAPLLCGTFLAASSILCVNLLIAMVTDTFQRVHDNSKANAVMQQAAVVLQLLDSLPILRRFYDHAHITTHCAPLAQGDHAPCPVLHSEQAHITREVKETLDEFLSLQKEASGVQTPQDQNSSVNEEMSSIRSELQELKSLVQQLLQNKSTDKDLRAPSK